MPSLGSRVEHAISERASLIDRFQQEKTTAFRLFHGVAEGFPGLTIDRFGDRVLVTTFREPLSTDQKADIHAVIGSPSPLVFRHRGRGESSPSTHDGKVEGPHGVLERGVEFLVDLSEAKLDPGLFLDFREARNYVADSCEGLSVLNLFAYTCTMGLVATLSGAQEVINSDHSKGHLTHGHENYSRNGVGDRFQAVQGDFTPVCRQYAGLPVRGRAAKRHTYPRLSPQQFDLVVLDPPTRTKSPFGGVDINRDYPSLFKPALLATRPGGRMVVTHHHKGLSREDWEASLRKTMERAGRSLRELEFMVHEPDFPSFDGDPPLKIAVLGV